MVKIQNCPRSCKFQLFYPKTLTPLLCQTQREGSVKETSQKTCPEIIIFVCVRKTNLTGSFSLFKENQISCNVKKSISAVFFVLLFHTLFSNNLKISNIERLSEYQIQFSVSWENSWRVNVQPYNYDAVWLFVKKKHTTKWEHLSLSASNLNYQTNNSGFTLRPASDGTGLWLFPNANFTGNTGQIQVTINLPQAYPLDLPLKVFGIEMVYVPQGAFTAGDGVSVNSLASNNNSFLQILSNNVISAVKVTNINQMFANETPTFVEEIKADFPKGYLAFYAMKYEISQQQYTDFLNCLTTEQQQNRMQAPPNAAPNTPAMLHDALVTQISTHPNAYDSLSSRNGICITMPANEAENRPAFLQCNLHYDWARGQTNDGLGVAANWLSWSDVAAFLDWAALRPMTELEYEKICRGANQQSLQGEAAWGTNKLQNANTLVNAGLPNETVQEQGQTQTGLANFGYDITTGYFPLSGPLRVGFAAASGRAQTGAAYYGATELSGNLWEQTVSVHFSEFRPTHGDGNLTPDGQHNVPNWPNADAVGVILRGGAWNSFVGETNVYNDLSVSSRFYAHLSPYSRRNTTGGRGVRVAE